MKAHLLAVVLGLTAATGAFANTGEAGYAGVNVGYSELKVDGYKFQDENDVTYGAFVGKDFGNYRVQADLTNYGKIKEANSTGRVEVKGYGVGVAAIYDFNTNTALTPYAGVRASVNRFTLEATDSTGKDKDKKTRAGYGLVGGLQYALTNQPVVLDLGVEWNKLAADVKQVGGKVGVAYKF